MIINHEEALQFAHMKRKQSNLARCYIELREAKPMTNDERRLLLACATVLMAQLQPKPFAPNTPSKTQQLNVLRNFLEPFTEFIREDTRRMRADD